MSIKTRFIPKEISFQWLAAGLLFVTGLLSFGIWIGQLGLFGDQWEVVLGSPMREKSLFIGSAVKLCLIGIIGSNALLYHLVNLVLFVLAGWIFLQVLIRLEMDQHLALICAMLFMVFPAFQQPAAAYALSIDLLGLIFACLSILLYLSVLNGSGYDWRRLLAGIGFACLAFLSSPVVAVIEGLSVPVICLLKCDLRSKKNRLPIFAAAGHLVLPFFVLALFTANTEKTGPGIIKESLKSWLDGFVLSWRQIIAMPAGGIETVLYLIVLALAAGILVFLISALEKHIPSDQPVRREMSIWQAVISGGMGLAVILILGFFRLSPTGENPAETGMVVIGMLVSIMIVGVIGFLFLDEYHPVILVLLIVLAAGARFQEIRQFANETHKVEDLLAQLQVRGETLTPGSGLVVEQLPFDFTTRGSLEALLRRQYDPGQGKEQIFLIPAENPEVRDFLNDEAQASKKMRIDNSELSVSKDRLLAIWIPPGACALLIDQQTDQTKLPAGISLAAKYSNPQLLQGDNLSDVKQLDQFRTKIKNKWCFYFQISNRLAQNQAWEQIIEIYNEAESSGMSSSQSEEYFPLLQAYLQMNRITDALELTQRLNKNPDAQHTLCKQWTQILTAVSFPEEVIQQAEKARSSVGCE
ncbi:MAG: hypothetical protein GYA15_14975 [Leptolinea sp.]|jgi:hypothetical protein|nr:hypothetical protein [Leptolinea sp.]